MRKTTAFLTAAVMLCMLCACSQKETFSLKDGLYLNNDIEMTPYVFFNTEENTWRCGYIAMSYALGGTYTRKGNRISAKRENSDETVIEFQIISENEIKAVTVKDGFFPEYNWIEEDVIYTYDSFDEESSGS
ncbi:MAG: hypothetical protein IJM63_10275 [Solobacterium sp.]|nr:hypothetical protein [Solobacterium sp.]